MSKSSIPLDQWGYPVDSAVAFTGDKLREALRKHAESVTKQQLPGGMFDGYLASSLEQIYSAREAFTNSAQNALTTLLVSYTAGSALIFWLATSDTNPPLGRLALVCVLAFAAFATPWLLRGAFMAKVDAGYRLYVAACVHSAIVHNTLNVPITHVWIDLVRTCHGATGRLKNTRVEALKSDSRRAYFPDDDSWTFVAGEAPPSGSNEPREPRLTSIGRIVAVWQARGKNLYWYYIIIFRFVTASVALLALGMIGFVVWASVANPTLIWHEERPACKCQAK